MNNRTKLLSIAAVLLMVSSAAICLVPSGTAAGDNQIVSEYSVELYVDEPATESYRNYAALKTLGVEPSEDTWGTDASGNRVLVLKDINFKTTADTALRFKWNETMDMNIVIKLEGINRLTAGSGGGYESKAIVFEHHSEATFSIEITNVDGKHGELYLRNEYDNPHVYRTYGIKTERDTDYGEYGGGLKITNDVKLDIKVGNVDYYFKEPALRPSERLYTCGIEVEDLWTDGIDARPQIKCASGDITLHFIDGADATDLVNITKGMYVTYETCSIKNTDIDVKSGNLIFDGPVPETSGIVINNYGIDALCDVEIDNSVINSASGNNDSNQFDTIGQQSHGIRISNGNVVLKNNSIVNGVGGSISTVSGGSEGISVAMGKITVENSQLFGTGNDGKGSKGIDAGAIEIISTGTEGTFTMLSGRSTSFSTNDAGDKVGININHSAENRKITVNGAGNNFGVEMVGPEATNITTLVIDTSKIAHQLGTDGTGKPAQITNYSGMKYISMYNNPYTCVTDADGNAVASSIDPTKGLVLPKYSGETPEGMKFVGYRVTDAFLNTVDVKPGQDPFESGVLEPSAILITPLFEKLPPQSDDMPMAALIAVIGVTVILSLSAMGIVLLRKR